MADIIRQLLNGTVTLLRLSASAEPFKVLVCLSKRSFLPNNRRKLQENHKVFNDVCRRTQIYEDQYKYSSRPERRTQAAGFAQRVSVHQAKLTTEPQYSCGEASLYRKPAVGTANTTTGTKRRRTLKSWHLLPLAQKRDEPKNDAEIAIGVARERKGL